jgi:hypothetical protein
MLICSSIYSPSFQIGPLFLFIVIDNKSMHDQRINKDRLDFINRVIE